MFAPIRTDRLLIRPMQPDDVEAVWERRNHPQVAEYQSWTVPYSREHAQTLVDETLAMDGPAVDEWWMATVEDRDGVIVGDLVVHLSWGGRTAEIGYSFHPDHWGRGYAVEGLSALIVYLFDTLEVTRVFGMMHPDNRASAQVMERCGFLFEGHTRHSFWSEDEVSDDWIYGLLRDDWVAWRERPRHRSEEVRLVEPSSERFRELYSLQTHKSQESFVAPVPKSLGQALLPEVYKGDQTIPWFRAIEADGEYVGFVMLATYAGGRETFLWRLIIDRMHQRRGIASLAMDLVEEHVRSERGESVLLTSWVPGRGSPEPFYLGRGYEPTGEIEDGEIIGRKVL